jgi:hypothetical protein
MHRLIMIILALKTSFILAVIEQAKGTTEPRFFLYLDKAY